MGSERLIGYNLFHKNGGFGSITSVNSDGNLFEGFDIEPFQPEPVTVSPSLQYELQIEASSFSSPPQGSVTLFPVSLTITRLPSLAEGWRFSDIGNSVFSSFTGIMIDRIASSTLAYGFSSSPIQGTVRWQPGSWSIIDFAAVQDLAYNARQALTVTTSTATLATATLDTGSFVFNDNHVGSFLSTTLGVGIIASVESSTQIQIHMIPNIVELSKGTMSSLRLGSIPAGSWSLSTLSEKYDFSDESMIRSRAWKLVLSECTVRRSNAGPTQYLKFYGNTSLMNEIQVDDLNALNPLNAYLNIAFSNSTLYSSNISIERNYHKKNAKVQISLKNKGSQGQAVIAYRSAPETLKCPPTQSSVRIVSSCPPTRLLKFTTYLNPKDSFKANITISAKCGERNITGQL
ncbi:hypothetical protein BC829DRAFT_1201 [Chytridium lagenaria]|nr:hypothetical protein BC829DRAFT_1201 [Chytridium lagenaria]